MFRAIRTCLLAALVTAPLLGCGDSGKSVDPKAQGTPDPNIKRLNQKGEGGGKGQPGGGGTPKNAASAN